MLTSAVCLRTASDWFTCSREPIHNHRTTCATHRARERGKEEKGKKRRDEKRSGQRLLLIPFPRRVDGPPTRVMRSVSPTNDPSSVMSVCVSVRAWPRRLRAYTLDRGTCTSCLCSRQPPTPRSQTCPKARPPFLIRSTGSTQDEAEWVVAHESTSQPSPCLDVHRLGNASALLSALFSSRAIGSHQDRARKLD